MSEVAVFLRSNFSVNAGIIFFSISLGLLIFLLGGV